MKRRAILAKLTKFLLKAGKDDQISRVRDKLDQISNVIIYSG